MSAARCAFPQSLLESSDGIERVRRAPDIVSPNQRPRKEGRRVATCDWTCGLAHKKPPGAERPAAGQAVPPGDYGASGVQLDPRPRALHSSVGIGITLKTLSVVSSFGSRG